MSTDSFDYAGFRENLCCPSRLDEINERSKSHVKSIFTMKFQILLPMDAHNAVFSATLNEKYDGDKCEAF